MEMVKKNRDITKIILAVVKTAGLLSLAIVAPNVISSLAKLGLLDSKKYQPSNYIRRRVQSMIEAGLLQKVKHSGRFSVELTDKGKARLRKYQLLSHEEKMEKWDRKWRVLTFDVWEKRRGSRDTLRRELKNYGFIQLQRSVWIYPYACSEFVELLKADLRFGRNVRYMVVEKIDNDFALKKYFKIS